MHFFDASASVHYEEYRGFGLRNIPTCIYYWLVYIISYYLYLRNNSLLMYILLCRFSEYWAWLSLQSTKKLFQLVYITKLFSGQCIIMHYYRLIRQVWWRGWRWTISHAVRWWWRGSINHQVSLCCCLRSTIDVICKNVPKKIF